MLTFSFYIIFELKFHQKKGLEIIQLAGCIGASTVDWTPPGRQRFCDNIKNDSLDLMYIYYSSALNGTSKPKSCIGMHITIIKDALRWALDKTPPAKKPCNLRFLSIIRSAYVPVCKVDITKWDLKS